MKLDYKRTFFIGFAFLSIAAFWQMYDSIVPLMLQNSFHLNETVTGFIMSLDNILAVFLLPLIGSFSDKVDTPYGKRTPFIVFGTMIAIIFMMILPLADTSKNLILFVLALGITLIAMAIYRTPAVALMPDLTPKPLRSKANAIINLMGAFGGMYSLLIISVLVKKVDRPSYLPVFIGIAFIMALAVVLLVMTTKEKKLSEQFAKDYPQEEEEVVEEGKAIEKDVKKSLFYLLISIFLWFMAYNAVTTAFSRYAVTVWNLEGGGFANCLMVATIFAILSFIPIGAISSRIGRKKTILIGIVMMTLSFIVTFLFKTYHPFVNVAFALIGIGWAAINVNSFPMVVEMSKGRDIGKYTGFYYTSSMTAQIITPMVSGALLQYVSYRTLFPYATIFSILSFITMWMVKHGDSKPTHKKAIVEHFNIED